MTDIDLQHALRALGARLDSEDGRDLVPAVLAALPARPSGVRMPRRRLVLVLAVLLVCAATAAAASDTIRGWFANRGVRIDRVATLPGVATLPPAGDLGLGRPVSTAEAARIIGVPLPASPRLGPPAGVYVAGTAGGPVVTERWRAAGDLPGSPALPGTGALLTIGTLRDDEQPFMLAKELSQQTTVDFRDVPGIGQAAYISGAPHAFTFEGTTERFRLAANVLLWSSHGHVYRLETTLPEAAMMAIASGLK